MDNRLIREALNFDMNKSRIEHERLHPLLNPEQRLIYEQVIHSMHNQRGQFYFVYGPSGIGKAFIYNTIIARLRTERKIVLAVTSSALLLPGGRTAHSRFIIPLELLENSTYGIKHNTYLAELMQEHDDEYLKERAILTPRNDDVDEINTYMFNKLVGKSVTYNSADEICKASTESLDQ
ncbi:ATP-dependent DNA helicase PIF1-like protein [Tanacetum coccineum]